MDDFFDDFRRLRKTIDKMFRDMFVDDFFEETGTIAVPKETRKYRAPIHDIVENDKEVFVTIELPGVKKEDIDINISENELEVKVDKDVEKKKEGEYLRTHLGFYKKITLPAEVDEDNVKATYNNGVLEIKLKKKKDTKKKKIKID